MTHMASPISLSPMAWVIEFNSPPGTEEWAESDVNRDAFAIPMGMHEAMRLVQQRLALLRRLGDARVQSYRIRNVVTEKIVMLGSA